jgi:hypothetical protein
MIIVKVLLANDESGKYRFATPEADEIVLIDWEEAEAILNA